jgi:ribosome-associated heat shock protein Hsp15
MIRLDKYLWSIRIYKTRSDATEACRSGRITVNGIGAKPSRDVRPDDILTIRKGNIFFKYKVIQTVEKRQPAKLVELYALNITPQEELDKLKFQKESFFMAREKGTGRPTKKERRDMDGLLDNLDFLDPFSNDDEDRENN